MQPRIRARRRAATARYFEMERTELDALLRDPGELRRAVVFVLGTLEHIVKGKE